MITREVITIVGRFSAGQLPIHSVNVNIDSPK